jgi:RNA polymerase sigma factor (sigma-70 family)
VFNDIFVAHWGTVRHHVECVLDDDDEVADLVSEVFSLAWVKLDVLRPLGLTWLLRVADNKLRDRDRSLRSRAGAMEAVLRMADGPRAHDVLDTLAVRHAIDSVLTPRERRFVIFFYWDRLAAGEIAELDRCSQASVFTTLSRARAKLIGELGRDVGSRAEQRGPQSMIGTG